MSFHYNLLVTFYEDDLSPFLLKLSILIFCWRAGCHGVHYSVIGTELAVEGCTVQYSSGNLYTQYFVQLFLGLTQEAKNVESWPNTTSAWAGWSRFDIPVDRYGGVHSLLLCTRITLGTPTCH